MLAVIKPTYDCNLSCSYCYADSARIDGTGLKLSAKILNKFFVDFFQFQKKHSSSDQVSFLWHGGEPMLLPISYYEKAIDLQKNAQKIAETNFIIKNSMQTNLTLANKKWISFFSKNKWFVSTSVDGPEDIHNKNRVDKKKNGTFHKTIKAVEDLKKKKVRVGGVCVFSKNGVNRISEIYELFNDIELGFRFNPLGFDGFCKHSPSCVNAEEYAQALIDLFDRWFWDKTAKIRITTLMELAASLLTGDPKSCSHCDNCLERIFALGPDGNIYPCGRFCGNKNFVFGNIKSNRLEDILNGSLRNKMLARTSNKLSLCRKCSVKDFCKGGCMHDSLLANGTIFTPTPFCETYKKVFKHIQITLNKTNIQKLMEN